VLEPAAKVVAVRARVGEPAVSGSSQMELSSDGLSTTGFVIPPDFKAVGQPLHHCIGSILWCPSALRSQVFVPNGIAVG
jgi:hypothetical protein